MNCGLGKTALVSVPPYLATLGVPYWASRPKSLKVLGWSLPKFHTHTAEWPPIPPNSGLSDQNG